MKASGPGKSAEDRLLEQLMVAAREQDQQMRAARPPKRRRRRRRGLALVIAVGLGAAAAAGAADLISTGEPVPDRSLRGPSDVPPQGQAAELVAKAPDPAGKTTWGVGIYTTKEGRACALAGQVRGVSLGTIRNGTFHPYERGTSGICQTERPLPLVFDRATIRGAQPRTVVFGIARDRNREVTATLRDETYTARPSRDGAFLFVFSGNLPQGQPQIGVGGPVGR